MEAYDAEGGDYKPPAKEWDESDLNAWLGSSARAHRRRS